MTPTIQQRKLCHNYAPLGIFIGEYLVRELDKYEIKHLKKLGLFDNLAAVPTELIEDFLS